MISENSRARGAPVDVTSILIERLVNACGIEFPVAGTGSVVGRTEREIPGPWESLWQERIQSAAGALGIQSQAASLSPAEIAGTLRPGQPAVAFRRTDANPQGWTLLLDRRWGKVFGADVAGDHGDSWVGVEELCRRLEVGPDERLSWLLCDPALAHPTADGDGDAGGDAHATPPLRRLLQIVRPDRADLWSIVVFGALVGVLTLTTPVAVQQLVNSVALGGLMQPVVVLALLLFAGLAFAGVLSALQAYVAEIVQRRIFVRVVADLAYRLPRVRVEAFDRQHGPELVNRFFDVMTVQKVGTTLLLDGVGLLLQTVIGLLVLSFYHPLMLAFSVVLLAGITTVVLVFGRGAIPTAIAESKAKYAMAGWLEEMARHASLLKTAGAAQFAWERADGLAREYLSARATHYRVVFRQLSGALGMQVVASSALLGLGGALVIGGQLTLGQLVASELIVTVIVASFAKLGKHIESYYDLLAAVDKLGHLFDLPLERDDGALHLPSLAGAALRFNDVSFRFDDVSVFDRLAFDIAPGERVALAGSSGSGKSTVVDLVLGVRSPSSGYVTFDGIDLRGLRLDDVREQVGRVGCTDVIEGTIEENVRMGRAHVTAVAVRDALHAVDLLEEVLDLPEGLRTPLFDGGSPLSASQVLRLALARAIAGRPRLLVLDDPLTALDEDSRRRVLEAIFHKDLPWTVLAVGAGADAAARCDRVVDLGSMSSRSLGRAAAGQGT